MDTGRESSKAAAIPSPVEEGTPKKIYPRLCLDGESAAYKELIDNVEVDEELKLVVSAKVVLISAASSSTWENRIEIEITDITPVGRIDKEFGE